jgi:peptidoglycan/xylan/chitin deacetylase (PgdA/CDA1 family)
MAAITGAVPSSVTFADPVPEQNKRGTGTFWPNGSRMVISVSMQMEGGAQPTSGAESPMPKIDPKYPDLPASKWYDYGYKEGLPRLLEVFDRRKIKVTSHMVGAAVNLHPALAKEIVQRGHEASGHGQTWTAQFSMTPEEERVSSAQIAANAASKPFPSLQSNHLDVPGQWTNEVDLQGCGYWRLRRRRGVRSGCVCFPGW